MRKTIIFTLLGFVVGLVAGFIITMAFVGYKTSQAMFLLQEKEIFEMEVATMQAYRNQPNEVAIWALENYIKTLNRLKEERSSAGVEHPYFILLPAQSLVLSHTMLGQLYKEMGYAEKSKHNFEQAMSNIKNTKLKAIKTEEDLIALINNELEYIWKGNEISRTFIKSDWEFYKESTETVGAPMQAFLQLVAVRGTEKKILALTTDLKGYVEIKTSDEALSFVRLFTDLDTHYLFDDGFCVEVRPTNNKPSFGELSRYNFAKLGLAEPTIIEDAEFFIVIRYVVVYSGNIYKIWERVSLFGDYLITKMILIAEDVDISYPVYF